jgi:response regulator NasT
MKICAEHRPDLALLDMRLGGMSGVDVARWLKTTLAVPFLFLSAYNDAPTVVSAAELGALGYLVKPLDIRQVLPAIRTALQRAKEIQKLHQAELDLNIALKTSRCISMAIGLLMQRFETDADETFQALRSYCRSNRQRMIDVAEQLVEHRVLVDLAPYLKNGTKH